MGHRIRRVSSPQLLLLPLQVSSGGVNVSNVQYLPRVPVMGSAGEHHNTDSSLVLAEGKADLHTHKPVRGTGREQTCTCCHL